MARPTVVLPEPDTPITITHRGEDVSFIDIILRNTRREVV
jgi:hypothetical protein